MILHLCLWLHGVMEVCVQKSVNLSSMEVEYVDMSELCQEIMFVRNIMTFLGVKIDILISFYWNMWGLFF